MRNGRQRSKLTLVAQPQAFFRELVAQALGRQRIATQPETEFYLVNLLNQFMTTDRLYPRNNHGEIKEEPLALMVKEALDETRPTAQSALFRHIGDVSLYVSGFFQDSLYKKLVDVDYYIGMGCAAYHNVAVRTSEEIKRAIYEELCEKFSSFVDVLAEVSDKTVGRTEKDILRMYELWLETKSKRAAKALKEAGIIPSENIKKKLQ
ncbi:MAG: hypothetical protein AAB116_04555 [Candidatus Poribacteria bacterium]|mgnify:CR=1 FL=1